MERGGWEFDESRPQPCTSHNASLLHFSSQPITPALSRGFPCSRQHTPQIVSTRPASLPATQIRKDAATRRSQSIASTVPSGLCIGFSYTDKHLSRLTLASPSTSLQDPTLLDQHKHKDKHTHPYPSSTADARRKTASFRSLICKRHGSKHVLLRPICPVGFMPCHQRASSASDLLGR